ncbi:hypothetical protein QE152_g19156 [Popillia japonica]|uniref:DDE Tnp4 domain-containing protein n=1 Tax=Popillia japonica TaxID=7064 RepID=A0AAW1L287_POPJA
MVARFRIFHTTIFKNPENVDGIVKACVCLHNYIKKAEQDTLVKRYCGSSFADADVNGTLIPGEWRNEAPSQSALRSITESKRRIRTRNHTQNATTYRDYIKQYVNSDIGSVPWQDLAINKYLLKLLTIIKNI